MDNSLNKTIHSAGAILRRENEKKLNDEIEFLVNSWELDLKNCEFCFLNKDHFIMNLLKPLISINNIVYKFLYF